MLKSSLHVQLFFPYHFDNEPLDGVPVVHDRKRRRLYGVPTAVKYVAVDVFWTTKQES